MSTKVTAALMATEETKTQGGASSAAAAYSPMGGFVSPLGGYGNIAGESELVPAQPACSYTCGAWTMTCACCIFGVATPIIVAIVLSVVAMTQDQWNVVLTTGIVLGGLAWLFFCVSISSLINGGVIAKPSPPPRAFPLVNTTPRDTTDVERGDPADARLPVQIRIRKLYLIVNPNSGLKIAVQKAERVVNLWREEFGIETTILRTERRGHAVELARTCNMDGYDGIVIVGGDGSFFELVNGVLTRPDKRIDIPVGLLPGGSGNSVLTDFGHNGHTDDGLLEAARVIGRGVVSYVDSNRVDIDSKSTVFSVNTVTWGLTGDVGPSAESVRWIGPARYDVCALWQVFKRRLRRVTLTINHEEPETLRVMTAFVMQTQHFGKELRSAPYARIDDGLLDLNITPVVSRSEMLKIFVLLPTGAAAHVKSMIQRQVHRVKFQPDEPGYLGVDGEDFPYQHSFEITCLHKVVRMFTPAAPTTSV